MRIEYDTKLDFSDVLIRPKRSSLNSRKEVDLTRTFTFKYSSHNWTLVPIVAANMDTTGTFEMALELNKHGMSAAIHKHYSENEYQDFINANSNGVTDNVFVSIGSNHSDLEKVKVPLQHINKIMIDIANGYSEHFIECIKRTRDMYPDHIICAGNVVTADMAEALVLAGADIVKCGIGSGCFAPGQKVRTINGLKNIEDITVGEEVLTHTGSYKRVINTFTFDDKKEIMAINEILATPNHEFYVLHESRKDVVTTDNLYRYAEWVEAANLTTEHLLIKYDSHNDSRFLEFVEIQQLETRPYDNYTYDLEVEDDHSYNIEGIIVHNSVCTTRIQTGVGYPQLSAVIECADAVHGLGGHLMSDGGCNTPADFAKAFGAGADFVMSGSFFAGHKQSGGEILTDVNGNTTMKYYGMSSNTAQEKHNGGVNDYRSSEGRTVTIPYKGDVSGTCLNLLGGIRSTCTYVGAQTIKQLPKRTTFIKVNNTHNRVFEQNTIRL